ncbi:MAG: caspase family protein [Myxococcales bacterium]|nr:caspase family protein [Myxococcales bacterium]
MWNIVGWSVCAAFAQAPDDTPGAEVGLARYHALLVAAQDYERGTGIPDLRTPIADVTAVAEVLSSQYGFEVTTVADATHEQLIDSLDQLIRDLEPDDALIVYYAGHGVFRAQEDRGYWLPVDANEASTARWVSTDDVAAKVRAMPARHVLVIADSCFSGVLTRGLDLHAEHEQESRPGQLEATRLAKGRSRWVITSGANEPVMDGGGRGISVFARALTETLAGAEERYLTADRLFPEIRRRVANQADQTPVQGKLLRGDTYGQFVFVNTKHVALRPDATDLDDLPAEVPTLRRGRPLLYGGGALALVGGALLASSSVAWASERDDFAQGPDGIVPPDDAAASRFRTIRALNVAGGVVLGLGVAGLGTGVGLVVTEGGGAGARVEVRR